MELEATKPAIPVATGKAKICFILSSPRINCDRVRVRDRDRDRVGVRVRVRVRIRVMG